MATWHPRATGETAYPIEATLEQMAESIDGMIGSYTSATINLTGNFAGSSITVYKIPFGLISLAFLDGQANGTIPAANTTIGNVPAGFRPFGTAKFAAGGSASTNAFMRAVSVTSGGDIVFGGDIVAGGSGIFFRAVPPWLVGN